MKNIALLVSALISIASPAFADSIKCYSNGRLIYSHHVKDVTFTGDWFIFTELSTDKLVIFNGECIAKIDA